MERKTIGFNINVSEKTDDARGNFGIIEGHGAAFSVDRGRDVIMPGAFVKTIKEHREKNRKIRMKFQHFDSDIIGGFDPFLAGEDQKGLFVVGEVNLDVQRGREAMALARQGVISDMSIGFIPQEVEFRDDIRIITEIELFEISLVAEPMNQDATIINVKGRATPFLDLPLADMDRDWNSDAAIGRVRAFTDSQDEPSAKYKNAFFYYDFEDGNNFASYKLPFVDIIDDKMVAVPGGIFSAAAALQGARGGVDIPDQAIPGVIRHVERYYTKMGIESPFTKSQGTPALYTCKQIKEAVYSGKRSNLAKILTHSGLLSKSAAEFICFRVFSKINDVKKQVESELDDDAFLMLQNIVKKYKYK